MNQFFVKYVKRVKNFPQITFVTPAKGNSRAKGNIKTSLNLVMLLPYHSFLSFARWRWTIIIVWIYLRMNLSLSLGNINASLMTLRTCMEVLRENQANAENGVSPKVVCFQNIFKILVNELYVHFRGYTLLGAVCTDYLLKFFDFFRLSPIETQSWLICLRISLTEKER